MQYDVTINKLINWYLQHSASYKHYLWLRLYCTAAKGDYIFIQGDCSSNLPVVTGIQTIFQTSILVSDTKFTHYFSQQVIYTHNTSILSVTKLYGHYRCFILCTLLENNQLAIACSKLNKIH